MAEGIATVTHWLAAVSSDSLTLAKSDPDSLGLSVKQAGEGLARKSISSFFSGPGGNVSSGSSSSSSSCKGLSSSFSSFSSFSVSSPLSCFSSLLVKSSSSSSSSSSQGGEGSFSKVFFFKCSTYGSMNLSVCNYRY